MLPLFLSAFNLVLICLCQGCTSSWSLEKISECCSLHSSYSYTWTGFSCLLCSLLLLPLPFNLISMGGAWTFKLYLCSACVFVQSVTWDYCLSSEHNYWITPWELRVLLSVMIQHQDYAVHVHLNHPRGWAGLFFRQSTSRTADVSLFLKKWQPSPCLHCCIETAGFLFHQSTSKDSWVFSLEEKPAQSLLIMMSTEAVLIRRDSACSCSGL